MSERTSKEKVAHVPLTQRLHDISEGGLDIDCEISDHLRREIIMAEQACGAALAEIERLQRELDDERERHAELQCRCYEGFPSASDGIFDAYRELPHYESSGEVGRRADVGPAGDVRHDSTGSAPLRTTDEPPNEMDHVLPPGFGNDPMSRALQEMMTCRMCAEKDAEIKRLRLGLHDLISAARALAADGKARRSLGSNCDGRGHSCPYRAAIDAMISRAENVAEMAEALEGGTT